MTELEPYDAARRDLRNPHTDSWTDVLDETADLARKIADTDFVPAEFRGNMAAVAAAILFGREVGYGPMQSLASLHSIKGRIAMSAESMRTKAFEAGHDIIYAETSSARCVVKGRRAGSQEWTTVTWTLDDAKRAKLGGDNWAKYPRQMLQARATAELCRLAFPDAIHGLAAVEELDTPDLAAAAVTAAPGAAQKVQRKPRPAPEPPPLDDPPRLEPPAPDDDPPIDQLTDPVPHPISERQRNLILLQFDQLGVTDRATRLDICQQITGGRPIGSSNDLTAAEASRIINTLAPVNTLDQLAAVLGATQSAGEESGETSPAAAAPHAAADAETAPTVTATPGQAAATQTAADGAGGQVTPPAPATAPGRPGITITAQITTLTRRLGGDVATLVSPLIGRHITRTSQLTAAEADLVLEELQAQHDQARQDTDVRIDDIGAILLPEDE